MDPIVYCFSFIIVYLISSRRSNALINNYAPHNPIMTSFLALSITCITGYFSPQLTRIMLAIVAFLYCLNEVTKRTLFAKCIPIMSCIFGIMLIDDTISLNMILLGASFLACLGFIREYD